MNKFFQVFLLAVGGILCLDTAVLMGFTNGNLGIWLPGIMGLPLLLLGIFYRPLSPWLSQGLGRIFAFLLLGLYCAAILYFAVLSAFLYRKGSAEPPENADALIVLGCAVYGEQPSLTLQKRLNVACDYLVSNPDTVCFVAGGQGPGETVSEALAMQRYLIGKGIDEGRIIMEDKSESTLQNFNFTKPLLEQYCGEDATVVYVSTRFHVYRAGRVAANAGITATGIGSRSAWYIVVNEYMRECVALTVYWLMGRI